MPAQTPLRRPRRPSSPLRGSERIARRGCLYFLTWALLLTIVSYAHGSAGGGRNPINKYGALGIVETLNSAREAGYSCIATPSFAANSAAFSVRPLTLWSSDS